MKKTKKRGETKKTRKQLRKEMRKQKKVRRNEYYTNRNKPGKFVLNPNRQADEGVAKGAPKNAKKKAAPASRDVQIKALRKEKAEQRRLQMEMREQRKRQLMEANEMEERNIRKLEKQLKLNKRKGASVLKSFASDGLDYLLEVCDPETMRGAVEAEKHFVDENGDEFEEDVALMASKMSGDGKIDKEIEENEEIDSEGASSGEDISEGDYDSEESNFSNETPAIDLKKRKNTDGDGPPNKKAKADVEGVAESDANSSSEAEESDKDGVWEDIYGRLRGKDGSVIDKREVETKYVPPAARNAGENADKSSLEKLNKLKRLLKGLLNRLAESNMHSIATQIEDLYMSNSRNDMNNTLTDLIFQSLIAPVKTPDRLLLEHVMLVTILHANIGTEVGAHFLQSLVKKFDDLFNNGGDLVEDKRLDNTVAVIAQLYNFKVLNSQLLYQILRKLAEKFEEKDVECILLVLKSVGFTLRKDDPLALKDLILELQKRAAGVSEEIRDNSRVKFMLDVLLAIKNNNVAKIPNYDTSYSERLKKLLKGFVRQGNYVTQLNVSLEDLLKADERGKWWIVGSAWSGSLPEDRPDVPEKSADYSDKLVRLAKSQHMNTDSRRSVFCIIMSAEDYLDAFEKLLRLDLKNQQEREIIHVILHCCLREKKFNPYYAHLAQKFCDYDRKFQMIIKCSVWDKLRALGDCSADQTSNLAKLLIHLFLEGGLPISTLKIMQFAELDATTLRFVRQILLGILLHDGDEEALLGVFAKVGQSDKLKMFRESLRLFLHHFLLKNLKSGTIAEEQRDLLERRAKVVEKALAGKEGRTRL